MPYSEEIDARIKKIVSQWRNTSAKKMFGGVCHLLNGNMYCGVYENYLILRLGEKNSTDALQSPFVKPFDITGRPMRGWVMVEAKGFKGDKELKGWLNQAKIFAETLPPKHHAKQKP